MCQACVKAFSEREAYCSSCMFFPTVAMSSRKIMHEESDWAASRREITRLGRISAVDRGFPGSSRLNFPRSAVKHGKFVHEVTGGASI